MAVRFAQGALQVGGPLLEGLATVPAVPGQPPEQLGARRAGFRGIDRPLQQHAGLGRFGRVEAVRSRQHLAALIGRAPVRRGQRRGEFAEISGDRTRAAPGGRDGRGLQVVRDQLIGPVRAERQMAGSLLGPLDGRGQPGMRRPPVRRVGGADDDRPDQGMGDEHAVIRGREQISGDHLLEIVARAGPVPGGAQDDPQAQPIGERGHQEKVTGSRR